MWNTIIIQPFVNVLLLIYQFLGNFGVAVILFTILIRLVTYPLTAKQLKASQAMQELQKDKRYIEIQTKYKNDKEKFAQEQMKLYKEMGINPMASCLPTLIQFPIIIGLYQSIIRALASTPIELLNLTRSVYPFFDLGKLIPLNNRFLWMDLGAPERLNLPFLNFGIPILAIVVVITTYMQSRLMQPPPTGDNNQGAMMTNMMNVYMPFLMGYMALTLASGLSLYFLISNVFTIVQYALMGKADWSNLLPRKRQGQSGMISAKATPVKPNPPKSPSNKSTYTKTKQNIRTRPRK